MNEKRKKVPEIYNLRHFFIFYTPPNRNTTPTAAERPMNTMGCHFFVNFTQLVSTSSTAASARPIQLTVPSQENRIKSMICS